MNAVRIIGIALLLALVLAATTPVYAKPPKTSNSCQAWADYFNTGQLDTRRWVVANGPAPG